ncbi:MAG: flavin reductase family protein [Ruminococcaceae bacterium]|nr:flavin reductase family protein [Oscillospiraceae bacterium]
MFRKVDINSLEINPFEYIGKKWMLITAGDGESFNTMTASWGTMGVLWNKPVTQCFIRPGRYTYEFIEKDDCYTLCFFGEEYRKALSFCGANSGRDVDKVRETGLTPAVHESGAVYFEEAELVLICRKLYHEDIDPNNFKTGEIEKNYPQKDYHRMYTGEIIEALLK